MDRNWRPLQGIFSGGGSLTLEDQAAWQAALTEFAVLCRIVEPLRADMHFLPQEEGVLVRGNISGSVILPCNLCAEDSLVPFSHAFDSFEPYPRDPFLAPAREKDEEAEDLEVDDAVIRLGAHGRGIEINPFALAWEEFSLTLPVKPLCGDNCKGLCPVCGVNRNNERCSCAAGQGDPRLSALRGLTLKK